MLDGYAIANGKSGLLSSARSVSDSVSPQRLAIDYLDRLDVGIEILAKGIERAGSRPSRVSTAMCPQFGAHNRKRTPPPGTTSAPWGIE